MDFIHLSCCSINKSHVTGADWQPDGSVTVWLVNGGTKKLTEKDAEEFATAVGHKLAHFDGSTDAESV